ncbi:hypothetical protein GGF42_005201, partial [Coemansia sp. RSA 2424]
FVMCEAEKAKCPAIAAITGRLGVQVYHCPFCPEYFALDIVQIQHHLRLNHG